MDVPPFWKFLVLFLVIITVLCAIVVPAVRRASARCEQEAAALRFQHWKLADKMVCLASHDGRQWVVLVP